MTPAGLRDDRSRTRGEIEKEGRRRSSRLWTSGVRSMFEARACVPAWTIACLWISRSGMSTWTLTN